MLRKIIFFGDILLIALLGVALIFYSTAEGAFPLYALIGLNIAAFIPLMVSAGRYAFNRKISVELLAAVALFMSFLSGEWFSAAFINLMLASARVFQRYTEDRGRRAIGSLAKMRPEKAVVRREGKNVSVPLENVAIGDEIIVGAGGGLAADGTIIEGEGEFDESSVTGESIPIEKRSGDPVMGGTILLSGGVVVKTEKVGENSVIGRIMRLVEEAEKRESKLQSVVSHFASAYVVLSVVGAGLIYIFSHDLRMVLSVLLVVCADDIAVAVPLAFLAAITIAARRGVVIKGAPFIEGLAKVKTFFFDKTGTLTRGKMEVAEKEFFVDMDSEFWRTAAGVLAVSTHPSAQAVFRELKIKPVPVTGFSEKKGMGMSFIFRGEPVLVGRLKFMASEGIFPEAEVEAKIKLMMEAGLSIVAVSFAGKIIAVFGLADVLRDEAVNTIASLKKIARVVMLTGDNRLAAEKIAASTGITEFRSELFPEDKVHIVRSGDFPGSIAMIGDGVNDAAALAAADVGIAMGGIGSEAAVETADVVLMKDDLSSVPGIVVLSKEVFTVVKQNIAIWIIINAAGLFLVFSGMMGPSGAAAYNFITDFIPIFNSLRIFGEKMSFS